MLPQVADRRWSAPAKLNLFLQIVGRREDGYHLLQSVFQLLDWGDSVRFALTSAPAIRRPAGAAGVSEDADLVVRAARLLQQAGGVRSGVEIRVDKQIPQGGGFGGGSSDAATVLLVLNRLWGLQFDLPTLAALGLQLGADVPFFIHGQSAWVEGVGEQVQAMTLGEAWYVLVDSGVALSTGELFQATELTRNAQPTKMADFVHDMIGRNAFELPARLRSPRLAALLDTIAEHGVGGLTGTGGGCYLRVEREPQARAAAATLARFGRCVVARGLDRSPLLEQLERM